MREKGEGRGRKKRKKERGGEKGRLRCEGEIARFWIRSNTHTNTQTHTN